MLLKRLGLIMASTFVLSTVIMGCSSSKPTYSMAPPNRDFITFKDSTKQEVTFKDKPQCVILLNTEVQELF
ncbi:hypothetical protein GCM10008018_69200 [Paenibacillus marchantiophytorum]|uniref:Uncharacterized protein n=1 Tax=Paenibacillus marchantiophytorum TaxID=1619310 RepID=A0ABQ1FHN5_9BACL|nr:hypothetical protein GCM10008018_69200 [Paenibacillus marchantiophytorum]